MDWKKIQAQENLKIEQKIAFLLLHDVKKPVLTFGH